MKKTVSRKLFLFGRYSLALLPPKKWLSKLGVKEGDLVDLKLESNKRRLIVSFDRTPSEPPTNLQKTKNNNKKEGGWEPIPRL